MRSASVMSRLLGVEGAVVEWVRFEGDVLVAHVRPRRRDQRRPRCPHCERICPGYDEGSGLRRWRTLDLGSTVADVEALAPRVKCPEHGVVVAAVPWARHGSRFTRSFGDMVAWLAMHCSKSAVGELMRTTWRSVGRIIERVVSELDGGHRLEGLRRIGIDEISYRKGHRYLTVVVDHDTGRLVWAAPGKDSATLNQFFDALGEQGCKDIEFVTADAAPWIRSTVRARCLGAQICMDPFHVVMWAGDALDEVRRQVWREARKRGLTGLAAGMKGARFALWKSPQKLTERQKETLAKISKTNRPLFRAYLLKEQLRQVFRVKGSSAVELLDRWLAWAQRSRLEPFVKLGRSIRRHRAEIDAALVYGLSNGRVESMNTKIRLITRRAFGFHGPQALIALAMLSLGGLRPQLPGRAG